MTATQPKSSPAELNDELHALIDLELGHPRRRTSSDEQAQADRQAVHAIAGALRKPDWDSELLEEIWGTVHIDANIVDQYVRYLRRKLDAADATIAIDTVRGRGYRVIEQDPGATG